MRFNIQQLVAIRSQKEHSQRHIVREYKDKIQSQQLELSSMNKACTQYTQEKTDKKNKLFNNIQGELVSPYQLSLYQEEVLKINTIEAEMHTHKKSLEGKIDLHISQLQKEELILTKNMKETEKMNLFAQEIEKIHNKTIADKLEQDQEKDNEDLWNGTKYPAI